MRIAKFISNSGVCSRREAERLIEQGEVTIDGKIVDTPAINVSQDSVIKVSDVRVQIPNVRLWLYYKPVGLITTHNDTHGRKTVFESLKEQLPRVISVGRLDLNSEGVLLLTNSGELARYFESPKNKIERIYKVRVFGSSDVINLYNKVINIDGMKYHPKLIEPIKIGKRNSWYKVILTEGKNREIRKIFSYFGFQVNRLIRTKFGKYSLDNLKQGEFKEVVLDEDHFWETQK